MTRLVSLSCSMILAAFMVSGCVTRPLQEPVRYSMYGSKKDLTEKCILWAARRRGWMAKVLAPQKILAVLNRRGKMIQVRMDLVQDEMVHIFHVKSVGMDYDGKEIHRSYFQFTHRLLRTARACTSRNGPPSTFTHPTVTGTTRATGRRSKFNDTVILTDGLRVRGVSATETPRAVVITYPDGSAVVKDKSVVRKIIRGPK